MEWPHIISAICQLVAELQLTVPYHESSVSNRPVSTYLQRFVWYLKRIPRFLARVTIFLYQLFHHTFILSIFPPLLFCLVPSPSAAVTWYISAPFWILQSKVSLGRSEWCLWVFPVFLVMRLPLVMFQKSVLGS